MRYYGNVVAVDDVYLDEGLNAVDDTLESNNNQKTSRRRDPPHAQYTRGIDVQNVTLQGTLLVLF